MHAWESIQKALEHVEDNLSQSHSPEELAKIAALSPFYFQRLFSRLVGKPVREYVKLRRLARASKSLGDKQSRILDIALDCGFGGHETFTKAFKEAYGMTPEAYRERPVMLNQFDKPDLLLHYVMIDEGVPLISDGLVVEFNRRKLEKPVWFMGVTGYIPIEGQMSAGEITGVDMPGDVWERFHRETRMRGRHTRAQLNDVQASLPECEVNLSKSQQTIPWVLNGRELGDAYYGDAPEGHFTYFAGAEVEESAEDARFVKRELPAREYIVCGFEAENFEQLVTVAVNKAVKYCAFWLKKHDLTMETYSPEVYYDSSPDAAYMELWMPVLESR